MLILFFFFFQSKYSNYTETVSSIVSSLYEVLFSQLGRLQLRKRTRQLSQEQSDLLTLGKPLCHIISGTVINSRMNRCDVSIPTPLSFGI